LRGWFENSEGRTRKPMRREKSRGEKGCQYKTGCPSMMHDVQGQRGHQDESKTTLEAVV